MTLAIILMGVSGSGKTEVGLALAGELGWPFYDGDDFHPAENVTKMASGIPLDDRDRTPWLRILREEMAARHRGGSWRHLSMGMTDDFEVAIEEGATIVRIGRALFGPRE